MYSYDTLLQGLAQHFQDVAAALRQLIQQEDAVVRQGHLTRQRHPAPADEPSLRNRGEKAIEAGAPVATPAGH